MQPDPGAGRESVTWDFESRAQSSNRCPRDKVATQWVEHRALAALVLYMARHPDVLILESLAPGSLGMGLPAATAVAQEADDQQRL